MRRNFIVIAAVIVIIATAAMSWLSVADKKAQVQFKQVKPVEYVLTDHTGRRVTQKSFGDKYTLVFFGYTFCPDVCPTALQDITQAMEQLGDKAKNIVPLFISFDPERDTLPILKDYVSNFHPSILGLSGTPAEINDAAKNFQAFFRKEPPDDGDDPEDYLISHTSSFYVVDPTDNIIVKQFKYGTTADQMAAALAKIL